MGQLYTREMQGIVGQASNFELRGQLSAFCARERLSQSSTELSCRRFDEERSKKSKRSTTNVVVRFFCVHISPRTSSTVVRVQVVGVSKVRTVAGMPGLVIALDTACACQWERGWTLKKRLKPTVVRSWHRAIAWKRRVTQFSVCKKKKNTPFRRWAVNELRKKITTVSCPPLFRRIGFFVGQVNQKTKEHGSMPAGPEAKESPGFFDLMAFSSEVLIFFCTVVQCWQSNAKAKLRQVRSVTNSKTNVKEHVPVQKIVLTQSYDAKILPAASYLDAGRRIKDSGRPVDIQWIPFVLRKTLFDFIKSCGCQIRLKFSAVALLGLLYSPK